MLDKKCSVCNITMKVSEFHFRNKKRNLHHSSCKKCRNSLEKATKIKPVRKFKEYIYEASRRSIKFDLTFDEFKSFDKKQCEYCGDSLKFIGLDRINNDLGYSLDNVVPSCFRCNHIKSIYSKKDFLNQINKIFIHQQKVNHDKQKSSS